MYHKRIDTCFTMNVLQPLNIKLVLVYPTTGKCVLRIDKNMFIRRKYCCKINGNITLCKPLLSLPHQNNIRVYMTH